MYEAPLFNLDCYIDYLLSGAKLSYFDNPNAKFTINNFIDSLCDFGAPSHGTYLGSRPGEQIKSLFIYLNTSKPRSVSYNTWFLYDYGYKYCKACEQVLPLNSYSSNISRWDSLSSLCKNCDNNRCRVYKNNNKNISAVSYKKWYESNKHIRAASTAKRRAVIKQAMPTWLTPKHIEEIKDIYKLASTQKMQVDHIVPLQGKNVCGLHVPWNLQLLSAKDNLTKSNKVLNAECLV